MLAFNDSRCLTYYTNIALTTSNPDFLNNPVMQTSTLYTITPTNQSLNMVYSFNIIATSTGPFTDKDGVV